MSSDYLVAFPGLGIDPFPVNRVAFSILGLPIYWYGLIIAIAAVLCMILAFRDSQKFDLSADDVVDIMLLVVPLMIIFARLYYVAFQWDYYRDNLSRIFDTRDGGLAFYGGVIGGVIGLFIFSKWKKKKVGDILDFCAVYVPLGQAIGRWGNFFNQEAFGTNTKLPWGMISNGTADYFCNIHNWVRIQPRRFIRHSSMSSSRILLFFSFCSKFVKNQKYVLKHSRGTSSCMAPCASLSRASALTRCT